VMYRRLQKVHRAAACIMSVLFYGPWEGCLNARHWPVEVSAAQLLLLRTHLIATFFPSPCSAVHNLVVALCALADDEADLLTYLAR